MSDEYIIELDLPIEASSRQLADYIRAEVEKAVKRKRPVKIKIRARARED